MKLFGKIPTSPVSVQGQFMVSGYSGLLPAGLAAGSDVVSFQWRKPGVDCLIHFFKWFWYTTTAFGAAQIIDHSLFRSGLATTLASGGSSLIPPVGRWNAKKSDYADSALLDGTNPGCIQISNTTALTTGDRTIKTIPLLTRGAISNAINAGMFDASLGAISDEAKGKMPLYLTAGEGIVLQNNTLLGATGVIKVGVEIVWSEIITNTLSMLDI